MNAISGGDDDTGRAGTAGPNGTVHAPYRRSLRWQPTAGTDVAVVAQARAWLRRALPHLVGHRPRPNLHDDAELLLCELATNAIRYGGGVTTIRLHSAETVLRITVCDHLDTEPVAWTPDSDAEHGRGLMLVKALATRWGSDCDEASSGKCVWFELSTTQPQQTTTLRAAPGRTSGT